MAPFLAATLVASAPPAQASPPGDGAEQGDSAEYDSAVAIGLQEMRLGNYAEAYAAMRRAHRISPNARTERGLGIAAFELKRYVASLLHLRAALAEDRKPLTAEMRAEVQQLIERVETNVERVQVYVDPPDAVIRVDGAAPQRDEDGRILLTVGEHQLTASLPGYQVSSVKVHADGDSSPTVSLRLSPLGAAGAAGGARGSSGAAAVPRDDAGATQRTWGYVTLAAGGVLAVGAGVALGLRESAAASYNSDACSPMPSVQCADDADAVDTMETLSIVAGAAAAGALVAGLVLISTAADADPDAPLACNASPFGIHCAGRF